MVEGSGRQGCAWAVLVVGVGGKWRGSVGVTVAERRKGRERDVQKG